MVKLIANDAGAAHENSVILREAINTGKDLIVQLNVGTYYFNPERYYLSRGQTVVIAGCGSGLTVLKRQGQRIDDDIGCLFRITGNTNARFRMVRMTWDGSADTHPEEPGDDQHHHVRIDGDQRMTVASFYDITTENLIADGLQIAATDLALVSIRDWRTSTKLGRVRRDVQFSYHPENAIVSDSVFNDFSSEPAGGTVYKCNLQMMNCKINRSFNPQRHGQVTLVNVVAKRLSSFSCEDGFIANCFFQEMGERVFYGPCTAAFTNTTFDLRERPLVFHPRYTTHRQNITFNGCFFTGSQRHYGILLHNPDSEQDPAVTYEFKQCQFPHAIKAVFQVQRGSWLIVKNSEFLGGNAGFEFNNRFGNYSKITEHDNDYNTKLVGYTNKASSSEETVVIESNLPSHIMNSHPGVFQVKPYSQVPVQIEDTNA